MNFPRILMLLTFILPLGMSTQPTLAQAAPNQAAPNQAGAVQQTAPRVPPPPDDVRIFVNGKDVTGSRNIKLKDVSVRFDADGNLHVDAPRYQLKLQPGVGRKAPPKNVPALSTAPPVVPKTPLAPMKPVRIAPSKRYFASIVGNYPSVLGCRISVLVNGEEVAKFNGQEAHLFTEITDKISRGMHDLEFQCRRPPSASPNMEEIEPKMLRDAFLEIHVGPGTINGPTVQLETIQGKIRCTDRTGGRTQSKTKISVE